MILDDKSTAISIIQGGPLTPQIRGRVYFRNTIEKSVEGTMVSVRVDGLPSYQPGTDNREPVGPHGFHIHEYGNCKVGDPEDPFQAAGDHWNPYDQPHGNHAGDFPVLFSNNGMARMTFFTNKFRVKNIIDRSVIIHENPDDYRTQPAGNSGRRLACGVIR
ncbi:MAG: superoxide dismutase family protein [Bacillota bacterium]